MKICAWCGRDFYRRLVKRYGGWDTGADFDDRAGRCGRCGESALTESRTTQTLRFDMRSILALRIQDRGVGERGWSAGVSARLSGEPPADMPERCLDDPVAEAGWLAALDAWQRYAPSTWPIEQPSIWPAETVLKQGLRAVAGGRYVDFLLDHDRTTRALHYPQTS